MGTIAFERWGEGEMEGTFEDTEVDFICPCTNVLVATVLVIPFPGSIFTTDIDPGGVESLGGTECDGTATL